jgi:aryl-alcohol dehydrogenase-like predicted oxidoreductase
MHFGETLSEERFIACIETAYEAGIRTFVTSDVYGNGKADDLLGRALRGIDRASYSLVGMIGHDFYEGQRQGSRGYPRFTDPALRGPGSDTGSSSGWRPAANWNAVAPTASTC